MSMPARARGLRVLAAAAVLSTLVPATFANAEEPSDEPVRPIVIDGRVRTYPWMRRADPAGFRDLGPQVGLFGDVPSYTIFVRDMNVDGWPDVFVGRHGWDAVLYLTAVVDGEPVGFERVIPFNKGGDRHGCAAADVDLDGLSDIYCAKGAHLGTARKRNELWMHGPSGVFVDRVVEYDVQDVWGRGRFPVFLDLNHDRWPDLFVGNEFPRADRHPTPNRTYVNRDGQRFVEARMGLTLEIGNLCSVAGDDGNGKDDLLVCGLNRMFLFRARSSGFRNVTEQVGLPDVRATAARFVHLDGDGRLDLVFTTVRGLQVRLQRRDHSYGPPVLKRPLRHGHGLAVGDPDGDGDSDIYVVEGCVNGRNMPDWLFLNAPGRGAFEARSVAGVGSGCGDTAEALDFDGDGLDEFFVLNGSGTYQGRARGPEQLLTLGAWGMAEDLPGGG
jgi:FG-GAP-like repeat